MKIMDLFKNHLYSLTLSRSFSLSVILTMSLTIGTLICAIGMVYKIVISPLPYDNSESLYIIESLALDKEHQLKANAHVYQAAKLLYESEHAFDDLVLMSFSKGFAESLPSKPRLSTTYVTSDYFDVFPSSPLVGGFFETEESLETAKPVAVISENTWAEFYDRAPDITEQYIEIGKQQFQIIGVMASDFAEPQIREKGRDTQVWLSWHYNKVPDSFRNSWGRVSRSLYMVGVLDKANSPEAASEQISQTINVRWQNEVQAIPVFSGWYLKQRLTSLQTFLNGDSSKPILFFLFVICGLLTIAIINIANLFVSRTAQRQRVYAIRMVSGAKLKDIMLDLAVESGILSFVSTFAGLVIAAALIQMIKINMSSYLPRLHELGIDFNLILVAVLLSCLLTLLFTVLRLKAIDRTRLAASLTSSGKGTAVQISVNVRKALSVTQNFAALVVIFVSMNVALTAGRTLILDTAMELENVYFLDIANTSLLDGSVFDAIKIRESLQSVPSIESVSLAESPFEFDDLVSLSEVSTGFTITPQVAPQDHIYFDVVNHETVSGSVFSQEDIQSGNKVIVVNEAFAKKHSDSSRILGARFSFGGDDAYVVKGVVKDIQLKHDEPAAPRVYAPIESLIKTFVIKLKSNAQLDKQSLTTILQNIHPENKIFKWESLNDAKSEILFPQMASLVITLSMALVVLYLSGLGMYGLINYNVQLRKTEIGLRMAIGAKKKDIIKIFMRENLNYLGISVGLFCLGLAFLILSNVISLDHFVVSLDGLSILAFSIATVALVIVLACWLPLKPIFNNALIKTLR